jgi:hypothetical protein
MPAERAISGFLICNDAEGDCISRTLVLISRQRACKNLSISGASPAATHGGALWQDVVRANVNVNAKMVAGVFPVPMIPPSVCAAVSVV